MAQRKKNSIAVAFNTIAASTTTTNNQLNFFSFGLKNEKKDNLNSYSLESSLIYSTDFY